MNDTPGSNAHPVFEGILDSLMRAPTVIRRATVEGPPPRQSHARDGDLFGRYEHPAIAKAIGENF